MAEPGQSRMGPAGSVAAGPGRARVDAGAAAGQGRPPARGEHVATVTVPMSDVEAGEAAPAAPTRRSMAYVPALDGLRAIAVVGVMLFHGGVSWVPGGFLGVDVFFVISGYLITTLLLREHSGTGGIDLRSFWTRRLRRLLPALLVLLAAVAVAIPFFVAASEAASVRGDALAALAYVANWRFILTEQSYFAGAPSPLRHLWSLSVEEQWYIAFPVVLALVLRRVRTLGPVIDRPGRRHRGLGPLDGPPGHRRGRSVPGLLRHRHPGPLPPGRRGAGRGWPPSGPCTATVGRWARPGWSGRPPWSVPTSS